MTIIDFLWQSGHLMVTAYTASDWAGCAHSAQSMSGGIILIGDHMIKQNLRPTAEDRGAIVGRGRCVRNGCRPDPASHAARRCWVMPMGTFMLEALETPLLLAIVMENITRKMQLAIR